MKHLFTPYQLNEHLQLKNRFVMAPMTRNMATEQGVPTPEMANYYAKRAEAGLIVTEGTIISPDARAYNQVPGIFTAEQVAGWRRVTDAVHNASGSIFLQLWHVGRVSHPVFLKGELPIGPSATTMSGRLPRSHELEFGSCREATLDDIKRLLDAYAKAANNALLAGFDGIELHGANGYLLDQFLHYDTNQRQDDYGGNPKNCARFPLEVVKACGHAIGFERVAIRLSPAAYLNQIVSDKRDAAVFNYLLTRLSDLNLAYVHTGNFNDKNLFAELNNQTMTAFIRSYYKGTLIACGSYEPEEADEAIARHAFDLIAIGRPFIANPDLIHRLTHQLPLRDYDVSLLKTLD